MGRWIGEHRRACQMAVSLLILALLPTPWPRVEFHNVRHHDSPGQVCEYHDHLLRWHPDASGAADVAILHWHWAWPEPGGPDPGHDGDAPRLHAHLSPDAVLPADDDVVVVSGPSSRIVAPIALGSPLTSWAAIPPHLDLIPPRPDFPGASPSCSPCMPRASLTARLHRWTC